MVFCKIPPSVVLKTKQVLSIPIHPDSCSLTRLPYNSSLEASCVVALMCRNGAGVDSVFLGSTAASGLLTVGILTQQNFKFW